MTHDTFDFLLTALINAAANQGEGPLVNALSLVLRARRDHTLPELIRLLGDFLNECEQARPERSAEPSMS
jgi:hypothetical protein